MLQPLCVETIPADDEQKQCQNESAEQGETSRCACVHTCFTSANEVSALLARDEQFDHTVVHVDNVAWRRRRLHAQGYSTDKWLVLGFGNSQKRDMNACSHS
jgi:hypothetical protein